MTAQVTTTGSVIGAGPIMKQRLERQRRFHADPPMRRSMSRARRGRRRGGEKRRRALARDERERRRERDEAQRLRSYAERPAARRAGERRSTTAKRDARRRGSRPRRRRAMRPRRHCRCIHRHAVQRPAAAPSMMSGAVKKIPVVEGPVEPAPDHEADQNRRHDRPAEHADLAEARGERGLPFVAGGASARREPRRVLHLPVRPSCRARSWRGLSGERRLAVAERPPPPDAGSASTGAARAHAAASARPARAGPRRARPSASPRSRPRAPRDRRRPRRAGRRSRPCRRQTVNTPPLTAQ